MDPLARGTKSMSRKRVFRNAPGPCDSGKKYKICCYGKGFAYLKDDDGTVFRSKPDEMKTAGGTAAAVH
jgi:hypothetical protein